MPAWFSWKRLLAVGAGLLILAAGFELSQPSALSTCGNLVLGLWIWPKVIIVGGAGLVGIGLLITALTQPEARVRSLGQGLLVAGISTGLMLGLIEITMRLTEPPVIPRKELYTSHPTLEYFTTANNRYQSNSPHDEYKSVFYTDENGVIIRDGSNAPRPNAHRIMFLGDSLLRGLEVAADENLSVLTVQQMDDALGSDVQQLNLGISGYSPTQYLLAYQTFAPTFDPQTVVVMFYVGNDFTEDARRHLDARIITNEDGEPVAMKPRLNEETGQIWFEVNLEDDAEDARPTIPRELWRKGLMPTIDRTVLVPLCKRLEFAAFEPESFDDVNNIPLPKFEDGQNLACRDLSGELVKNRCTNYAIRDETLIRNNWDAIFKDEYTAFDQEDIEFSLNSLRSLAQQVEAERRQLLIVIIPANNQIPNQGIGLKPSRGMQPDDLIESTHPQQVMASFCEEEDLDCIDLLPVMLAHQDEQLYWVYDTHLTPRGHQVIADVISQHLLETLP